MDERLLTLPDVGRILGLGRTRVHQLTASGALTVVRIGRAVRVSPGDLEQFIAEHREAAGQGTGPTVPAAVAKGKIHAARRRS